MVLKNGVLRKTFGSKRQKGTEDCIMRFPHLYHTVDEIYKNEMDGSCGTYEVEESCVQRFGGEN